MSISSICPSCCPTACTDTFKKISWLDVALIVGAVGLVIVGLLSQLNVINPSFHLPQFGTVSAAYIAYALYSAAGLLLLIETAIFLCKQYREIDEEEETGSEIDLQTLPDIDEAYPLINEQELFEKKLTYSYDGSQLGDTRAFLSGNKIGSTAKTFASERKVTIGEESGMLLGVYPQEVEIEELVEEIQEAAHKDVNDTLAILQKFCQKTGASVAIQLQEIVYVAGRHFLYYDGSKFVEAEDDAFHLALQAKKDRSTIYKDLVQGAQRDGLHFTSQEPKSQVVILASTDILETLKKHNNQPLKQECKTAQNLSSVLKSFCETQQIEDISLAIVTD